MMGFRGQCLRQRCADSRKAITNRYGFFNLREFVITAFDTHYETSSGKATLVKPLSGGKVAFLDPLACSDQVSETARILFASMMSYRQKSHPSWIALEGGNASAMSGIFE